MDVYDKITKILDERGMSRRQLAIVAGIPPTTLNSAFSRKADGIAMSTIVSIANALNVPVETLLDEPMKNGDHFRTPRFVILDWLDSIGYPVEAYEEEGALWIRRRTDDATLELREGELEEIETELTLYTQFLIYKLASRAEWSVSKGRTGGAADAQQEK